MAAKGVSEQTLDVEIEKIADEFLKSCSKRRKN
jgi:hypothetical protein